MLPLTRETVREFYSERRIAVVGASRDPRKFGRQVLEALAARGFEAVPVNPRADRVGDRPCHPTLAAIPGGVGAAIVLVPPAEQREVVRQAAEAGLRKVWIHDHPGKGVTDPGVLEACREAGIEPIAGYCPLMFMPGTGLPHRIHRGILGLLGRLPR